MLSKCVRFSKTVSNGDWELSKCVENSHVIANLTKIAYCMTCEAYYDITDGQLLSKKGVIKTE
tara:strand:+ start:8 stop:196 length:189 start_codon:yes stop_codon:yes gene_type:complete